MFTRLYSETFSDRFNEEPILEKRPELMIFCSKYEREVRVEKRVYSFLLLIYSLSQRKTIMVLSWYDLFLFVFMVFRYENSYTYLLLVATVYKKKMQS